MWSSGRLGARNPSLNWRYRVLFRRGRRCHYHRNRTAPCRYLFLRTRRWSFYLVGRVRGTPAPTDRPRPQSTHGQPRYFHMRGTPYPTHDSCPATRLSSSSGGNRYGRLRSQTRRLQCRSTHFPTPYLWVFGPRSGRCIILNAHWRHGRLSTHQCQVTPRRPSIRRECRPSISRFHSHRPRSASTPWGTFWRRRSFLLSTDALKRTE